MKTSREIVLSREELYRRIWERPLREVATELGISDVGLKKVCRRHNVPTPPQGYHLMSEDAAKRRLQVALPPPSHRQSDSKPWQLPKIRRPSMLGSSSPGSRGP